jgi:hypothetical protein
VLSRTTCVNEQSGWRRRNGKYGGVPPRLGGAGSTVMPDHVSGSQGKLGPMNPSQLPVTSKYVSAGFPRADAFPGSRVYPNVSCGFHTHPCRPSRKARRSSSPAALGTVARETGPFACVRRGSAVRQDLWIAACSMDFTLSIDQGRSEKRSAPRRCICVRSIVHTDNEPALVDLADLSMVVQGRLRNRVRIKNSPQARLCLRS